MSHSLHARCDHASPLRQALADSYRRRPEPRLAAVPPPIPRERRKLWDLDSALHCSLIGTCFSTADLRATLAKVTQCDLARYSELEVHETAVTLSRSRDTGKVLHKALDRRYQVTVERFEKAHDPATLRSLWAEARDGGDVAGGYWAMLTHRDAPWALVQEVFGEVHMLSHLVGASHRADLRRLAQLEKENVELACRLEAAERQARESLSARDDELREARAASRNMASALARARRRDTSAGDANADGALNDRLTALERRAGVEIARREAAERRASEAERELAETRAALAASSERWQELEEELSGFESELAGRIADLPSNPHTLKPGTTILYVGGRPAVLHRLRAAVEQPGGVFLHHDGGVEDRRGLLASQVARADMVFFPVDCVSHDAALGIKRLCQQAGKAFAPLRNSGMGSFLAALERHCDAAAESF